MSWRNQNSTNRKQIAGLCLVVVLSLVIPLGIVYWSVASSMSGKPFGWHSNTYKSYSSAIKDGELWYLAAFPMETDFHNEIDKYCHIQRLNLETGIESDSGISANGINALGKQLCWVGNDLYLSDKKEVFRVQGNQIEPLGARRSESISILGLPFEYEGNLTIVVATEDGGHRLSHWINERWTDGRKILLPGSDRVWYDDPQNGRKSLLPLTSLQPLSLKAKSAPRLDTLKWNGEFHLTIRTADSTFAAYRHGFDFVDNEHPIASAQAPENSAPEVTGWEPIPCYPDQPAGGQERTPVTMFANRDGLYWLVWDDYWNRSTRPKIIRRDPHGQFEEVTTEFEFSPRSDLRLYSFAANPDESKSYLIRWSQHETDAASISRIERNFIRKPHLSIPGAEREYFARWKRVVAGLLVAWMAHWIILATGVCWLTESKVQSGYSFGIQRVKLASVWRRGLAFVIDVVLTLSVTMLTLWAILKEYWDQIVWPNDVERHDVLFHVELLAYWFVSEGESPLKRIWMLVKPIQPFIDSLPWNQDLLAVVLLMVAALYAMKLYLEARFGFTFGARLLGVRTIRTSLRPAGIARSLVRDVMIWCDVPLLLSPIPAAISMILSPQHQRLGDRVADTIVIQTRVKGIPCGE